jgi:hypothetical protein
MMRESVTKTADEIAASTDTDKSSQRAGPSAGNCGRLPYTLKNSNMYGGSQKGASSRKPILSLETYSNYSKELSTEGRIIKFFWGLR